ncbi:MAG: hypothetical protein QOD98_169 [Nocardioidaceae bacterium]|jgi:hypothetical protein|nr:hypothetical protein [Nocardioidaceae bacterium]
MLSKIRMAIVLVLVAGLVVSAYEGYRLFTEKPDHDPLVSRVTGSTDDGWQQVSYRGVTVELPPEWGRLDMGSCQGSLEHWGPADVDPCADDLGLWFLASATFDSGTGPGAHAAPASANLAAGGWTGYVTRGEVVVNVADADEAVVRRILQSVSQTI